MANALQRSDSASSTGSRSSGTFGYHQRLLEGSSSSNTPSLSRAGSLSQRPPSILSPPIGSSSARKFIPTHRTGQSIDQVQSRTALWEERARANDTENLSNPTSSLRRIHRQSVDLGNGRQRLDMGPPPPPKQETPSKRHTLSMPLDISTYLPPSIHDSTFTPTLPLKETALPTTLPSTKPVLSHLPITSLDLQTTPPKTRRSTETVNQMLTGSSTGSSAASSDTMQPPSTEYKSSFMLQRRSAKKYGDSISSGRKLGNHMPRIASGDGNEDFEAEAREERRKQSSKPLPMEPEQDPVEKRRSFAEEQRRTDAHRDAEAKLNGPINSTRTPLPSHWDAPNGPEHGKIKTRPSTEEKRPKDHQCDADSRLSGSGNGTRALLQSQWDSLSRMDSPLPSREGPSEERKRTDARTTAEAKPNVAGHGSRASSMSSQWENRKIAPPPISPSRTTALGPLGPSRTLSASQDMSFPSLSSGEDVAGIPGRLHLSRNASAPPTPMKTRPMSGLWADVQRHLIQAYEYMCHVGEAQQWIEGCLGEELGFGVVEMDEGMRNGVVLARLAQVWDGASVRKIFDVRWPWTFSRIFTDKSNRTLVSNLAGGTRITSTTFLSLCAKSVSRRYAPGSGPSFHYSHHIYSASFSL
jgi:Ras GTPase-activating-like protein IQGAP2/3